MKTVNAVYFYHFPNFLKNSSDQRPEVSFCALLITCRQEEVKGSLLSFSSNRVSQSTKVTRMGHQGNGGAKEDRTPDLLRAKQALSQLSYGPLSDHAALQQLVGLGRFELPTSPLSGVRSNQLSYRPNRLTLSLTNSIALLSVNQAIRVGACQQADICRLRR